MLLFISLLNRKIITLRTVISFLKWVINDLQGWFVFFFQRKGNKTLHEFSSSLAFQSTSMKSYKILWISRTKSNLSPWLSGPFIIFFIVVFPILSFSHHPLVFLLLRWRESFSKPFWTHIWAILLCFSIYYVLCPLPRSRSNTTLGWSILSSTQGSVITLASS